MGTNINKGATTPPHPEEAAKTTATTTATNPKLWHRTKLYGMSNWRPPPASCCPAQARGQVLLKEEIFEEAIVEFRAALADAADSRDATYSAPARCRAGAGAGAGSGSVVVPVDIWTNEEVILSTRLFLLKAYWASHQTEEAFIEAHAIQTTVETTATKTTPSNCRSALLLLACQTIAHFANDTTNDITNDTTNNSLTPPTNCNAILALGLSSCRIILTNNTPLGGNPKQRRVFYTVESELHERNGDLSAAASSIESLIASMPPTSHGNNVPYITATSRLYELRVAMGVIDVEQERVKAEALEARRVVIKAHRQQRRRRVQNERSHRLGETLTRLAPQIKDRVERPANNTNESTNESTTTRGFFEGLGTKEERAVLRSIDWGSVPPALTPDAVGGGGIRHNKGVRIRRKRMQLEALFVLLVDLIERHNLVTTATTTRSNSASDGYLHIVDFGAGSGNSCLVFCWLLRDTCRFTLVENNSTAVAIGKQRTREAGLESTVSWMCGDVADFDAPFDIGLATHLCGGATDLAMANCLDKKAAFLVTPCCLGKLKYHVTTKTNNSKGNSLQYPRSTWLRNHLSAEEYVELSRFGDCSVAEDGVGGRMEEGENGNGMRLEGKMLLDADRLEVAREAGYETELGTLGSKSDCGPKSDVLCGMCRI